MVNVQVNTFWDRDLSQPGHAAVLVRDSGDSYKSVSVQCWGSQHPYAVEEGDAEDDCGWIGPNIPAGRWQEKHVREAYQQHFTHVAQQGPIQHGAEGNYPGICQCPRCRLELRPGDTGSYPEAGEGRA